MDVKKLHRYVDEHQDEFISELKRWVAIRSVSGDPNFCDECLFMVHYVEKKLIELGAEVRVVPNPCKPTKLPSGKILNYSPIILASYKCIPGRKTVCVYGHLDVQPANKTDGWATDPFELTLDGDKMIGRGSTDDKGPVLGWLCILQLLNLYNLSLNVNLKMVFECMEECGSDGLEEVVQAEKDQFFKDVQYICISDNYWLGVDRPCVTYGTRGIVYFCVTVTGSTMDLHSGVHGGAVHEPMTDLFHIMSKLVDSKGTILIPALYDEVDPLSLDEQETYKGMNFNKEAYAKEIGVTTSQLLYQDQTQLLMHRWRYPSLSLHGVEGAYSEPGTKTVIPCKVTGKFSVRLVPNMSLSNVVCCVERYIDQLAKEIATPNKITVKCNHGAEPWLADTKHPNFLAASKATETVYGVKPLLTREGGSIPITLTFAKLLKGGSVLLLPMGRADDGAHSQNEKLNKSNFINGIKLFISYLDEVSKV